MFLADVVGTVVSPVQHPILEQETLLLLRPVTPHGHPTAKTRVGLDRAQAGVGDRVLVIDEGNSSRQILGAKGKDAPVKTIVIGVVDYVAMEGAGGEELTYDHRDREPVAAQRPGGTRS